MNKNQLLIELSEHASSRFWKSDFDELTKAEKVFRIVWELESEVNNGGFEQYFLNASGDLAFDCPRALRTIGAMRMAEIVESANRLFPEGEPPREVDRRQVPLESISGNGQFEELEQSFFAYPDNLTELLYGFVSKHRDQVAGATEVGI